jgi:hypothetical protein
MTRDGMCAFGPSAKYVYISPNKQLLLRAELELNLLYMTPDDRLGSFNVYLTSAIIHVYTESNFITRFCRMNDIRVAKWRVI